MGAEPEWEDDYAKSEPLLGTEKSPLSTEEGIPDPDKIEVARLKGSIDKLTFRAWLWLQHHDKTAFAPLARFILGGGPEGIWINKPLKIVTVVSEIETFYASKHGNVKFDMVEMARRSARAYHDDVTGVEELIKKRRKDEREAAKTIGSSVTHAIAAATGGDEGIAAPGTEIVPARDKAGDFKLGSFAGGALVITQCEHMIEADRRCQNRAEPGSLICVKHGGILHVDEDSIKATIKRGQAQILSAAESAIDTVLELMRDSVQDGVRLKAAEMILDRAGFGPQMSIEVDDKRDKKTGITASEIIAEKMKILSERAEPVDAEIVEDGPDVPQFASGPETVPADEPVHETAAAS